jgi:dTDP-4-amino-4,6-dideoxygalactose transaminase
MRSPSSDRTIPFLDLPAQHRPLKEEILASLATLIDRGQFVLGEAVERFEREVASYLGVREAIGVASGTDALYLALRAAGVGPGDEVITPAFSFFAIAEAIGQVGATAVYVDIDEETMNISPEAALGAVTRRTKAIVPVHLYGLPAPVDAIRDALPRRGVAIIEDAAQAFGASQGGRKTGGLGDLGAFSFYPTKNLAACGDGGLVTTDDEHFARTVRVLRDHGQGKKYVHERFGWNSRLDAFQAAILSIKLPHIDRWNARRREIARRYREALVPFPVRLPAEASGATHVYHQFTLRLEGRNRLRAFLAESRISTAVHYPAALHEQPLYEGKLGSFPAAEKAAREVLSLPVFPELTDEEVSRVTEKVGRWFETSGAEPTRPSA